MMFRKETLLFITFFSGLPGNCPAEWADDKLRVLESEAIDTIVLTGIGSNVEDSRYIKYYKVPSLSWNDFFTEINDIKLSGRKAPFYYYLLLPIILILGVPIDLVLRFITKGVTAGKWSWLIPAFFVAIYLILIHRVTKIFTTGGPSVVHLLGLFIKVFCGARLICEFQDPLIGSEMRRSSITLKISNKIERLLACVSNRLVYVTERAGNSAKKRHPKYASKIISKYPGSWDFGIGQKRKNGAVEIELLHLGTLYGARNLDFLFKAIDELDDLRVKFKVINVGAVYCENFSYYQSRNDFTSVDTMTRKDALLRASEASCLLLVQHADSRSEETIPYKTYDYLNLGIPIIGLLNNEELASLLVERGHMVASSLSIESIKSSLLSLTEQLNINNRDNSLNIKKQFMDVLE